MGMPAAVKIGNQEMVVNPTALVLLERETPFVE